MLKASINKAKDKLFKKIHNNNLIYNTCWEDPRLDRNMLQFDQDSNIVMITSAGCNALDYLLDNPAKINCIDVNPRQNALLELKKALFKHGDYNALFEMFGNGHYPEAEELYKNSLRAYLPDYAQEFWDEKIFYFTKEKKKSFYFYGTAGTFAWIFSKFWDANPKTKKLLHQLLDAKDLDEQKRIYDQLEPKIMSKIVKWLMNRHLTMSLLGVPRPQRQLIIDGYPGGISGFLQDNLRHIFAELPIQDNYFWYLYVHGKYSKTCCPQYLKEENFEYIQARIDRIETNNTTITDFLQDKQDKYSHFILLDHQDWLASHDPSALKEEWDEILKNGANGSKVLMRSASLEIDFFPSEINERITFEHQEATTFHRKDRVGTYGCTYLGEIAS